MTVRNPIVLIPGGNPQFQELPAGDVLGGAAQGPVGMTWQGAWSSGTTYAVDDVVSDNGSAYIAIAANTNHEPPNATYWNLLASKGDTGDTGATGPKGDTGAAGGDFIKITSVTTSSSQATIGFSSIPGTYTHLKIIILGRDTSSSVASANVSMLFNSDTTAANYSPTQNSGANAGSGTVNQVAASTNGGVCVTIPGTSSLATAFGGGEISIPLYAGTTFHKMAISTTYQRYGSTSSMSMTVRGFAWLSTAAITSITLTAGGTAFLDGTRATLYGIN